MFKTIKRIRKKIIAAAMATAILVSNNIGMSSVNSGNHAIMDTTVTVSAKTIYYCPYCAESYSTENYWFFTEYSFNRHLLKEHNKSLYTCPYCNDKLENQTALDSHKQTCPWKNKSYIMACPYNYDGKGCNLTIWGCPDEYEKHLETCYHRNHCPLCKKSFWDYGNLFDTIKLHITYDCLNNKERQLTEDRQLDLTNRGLLLPKWDVENLCWRCPYSDCGKIFASPYDIDWFQDSTEDLVVEHIHCHYRYASIDKATSGY